MAVNEDFVNFVCDQLSEFGDFQSKKMFGGIGFFRDGVMFGMIGNDIFRLKVDDSNKADFESKGMKPYRSENKKKGMPYWEVPPDVLEDKTTLSEWAERSYAIAIKNKKRK